MERKFLFLVWFSLFYSSAIHAEEFLGTLDDDNSTSSQDSDLAEPTAPFFDTANLADKMSYEINITGNLNNFAARLSGIYHYNKWLGMALTGTYYDARKNEEILTLSGVDLALIGSVPNRTIVTPFAQSGLGQRWWEETYQTSSNSDRGSLYFNGIGISIKMSQYIVLHLEKKRTFYFYKKPFDPTQEQSGESKDKIVDEFLYGFSLVI